MKRSLLFGAVLTVGIGFGGAVAAGALEVPGFDAGPDTMLCYSKTGAVTKPAGSTCPRGSTEFFVAGASQVDAVEAAFATANARLAALESTSGSIAARLDALEGTDGSLAARLDALEDANDLIAAEVAALGDVDESVADLEAESASLATRLAALEHAVSDLASVEPPSEGGTLTLTAVPGNEPNTWGFLLEGEGLVPGTVVNGLSLDVSNDVWYSDPLTAASPDGIVYHDGSDLDLPCDLPIALYVSGTGDGPDGEALVVSRTISTGPNCG